MTLGWGRVHRGAGAGVLGELCPQKAPLTTDTNTALLDGKTPILRMQV